MPPPIVRQRPPSALGISPPLPISSTQMWSGTCRANIRWRATIAVMKKLLRFLERVSGLGFVLTEEDVFGNNQHVCALSQMGARRPGLEVTTRVVSIFRFRDQRQLERWFYPDDIAAWHAIFTDES